MLFRTSGPFAGPLILFADTSVSSRTRTGVSSEQEGVLPPSATMFPRHEE
jgi:hypothetical protein